MSVFRLVAVVLVTVSLWGKSPLSSARQILVVTTPGWDNINGKLQRYERRTGKAAWQPVGEAVPIIVGRSGLAWGSGVYPAQTGGPVKKEGDGRSPAGIYRVPELFGYAPKADATGFQLPYVQATDSLECVDDVNSRYYNRLVDRNKIRRVDWKSSEDMHRKDELYRWGAVVAHNSPRVRRGGGSCIFLHIGQAVEGSAGTAGCTAMREPALLEVLRWLDPKRKPLLVQLPEAEYRRLQTLWALPAAAHQ